MKDLVFKKLYEYVRPHLARVMLAVFLSFIMAGIGAYQVALVKPIFDHGLSADSTFSEIGWLVFQLLLVGVINFPSRFYHFYHLKYVVDRVTLMVRHDLFQKLQTLPMASFNRAKQGTFVSNMINDTHIFAQGMKAGIDMVREPLKAIAYLVMAFWADWQLALLFILVAPILGVIFSVSGKKIVKNQTNVQERHADITHHVIEGIGASKLTKAFNLQNFVKKRFTCAQEFYFNAQMKTTFVQEMAHPFVEILGTVAFCAVILFAHYRISSGETTIGDFVSFVAALALFMDPMRKFSSANVNISQSKAAAKRIFTLMEMQEEIDDGKCEIKQFNDKIMVKNLNFSYDNEHGEHNVLKNFSMIVPKGKKIALVGLSGSGKSTLINLLLRLYPIKDGEILIDGVNICDLKLASARALFGLVSQDIFLFNDTIKENLCLGGDFSDLEITEALKVSYAWDFVSKLPEGVHTLVGDRGVRLSGGQQQRLTIARAFLHKPQILLFDEATSALDNESEKVVQKALEEIGSDKTVVAVAHRLSTIQDYDHIYVLSEGHLVEEGTHEILMSKNGEYAKLYELGLKK